MNHFLLKISFFILCLAPLRAAPQGGIFITTHDYCSFLNSITPAETSSYLDPKMSEMLILNEPDLGRDNYSSVYGKGQQPISYLSYADVEGYRIWKNQCGNRAPFLFFLPYKEEAYGALDRALRSNQLFFLLSDKPWATSITTSSKLNTLKYSASLIAFTIAAFGEEASISSEDLSRNFSISDSERDSSTSFHSLEETVASFQEADLAPSSPTKTPEIVASPNSASLLQEIGITFTPELSFSNGAYCYQDPQREMALKLTNIYYLCASQLAHQGIEGASLFQESSFSLYDAIRRAEEAKNNSSLEKWYHDNQIVTTKLTALIKKHSLETEPKPLPSKKRKRKTSQAAEETLSPSSF